MKGFGIPHSKGFGSMFTKTATKDTPADKAVNMQQEERGHSSSTPSYGGRNSPL